MSYTEIYGFDKEGNAYLCAEIKNAWRGAMAIWDILEEKYLPPFVPEYAKKIGIMTVEQIEKTFHYKPKRTGTLGEANAMKEIWDLYINEDVDINDRICLGTTFDHVLVKKENLTHVIEAFRSFEGETSLKEQADVIEKMMKDEECIAVGWNQTSIGDGWNIKGGFDEEADENLPYNCLTGTIHWWLFGEGEIHGKVKD